MFGTLPPTIINEDTQRSNQPPLIKTKLKEHQLAMIHEMTSLETPVRKKLKIEGGNNSSYSFETQFGCICDKVGSGKSLTVLGLIASKPFLSPSRNVKSNFNGLVSIYEEIAFNLPINLLVVPHGIISQWISYLDSDTELDYTIVNNTKTLNAAIEKIDLYKDNPHHTHHLDSQGHLHIVSSTFYNKLVPVFYGHTISRLIVDEVVTIKIRGSKEVKSLFTWFISSSKSILLNPEGEYRYVPHTYTSWNGQTYNLERRERFNKIANNGYFKNILIRLVGSDITNRIYLKSDDEFVEKSFSLPEITTNIIKCKNTTNHNVLNGIVDNETMNMINAGDIKGAIENMGCKVKTQDSLIKLVTKKLKTQLNDKNAEYTYKSQIFYSSEQAKTAALENIQKQIDEIQKKIDCIKARILENNHCPICADDIENKVIVSCCNNPFCFECISVSLTHKPVCPMCRTKINTSNIIALDENKVCCEIPNETDDRPDEEREKIDNFKIYFDRVMSEANKKLLIFSKYEASFSDIKEHLVQKDIKFAELKGHPGRIRNIVEQYKSDSDGINVLLLNAQYFGSGLNLENTTDIFLYHNMGKVMTNQVIGRAQRPGRTSPLNITRFCYNNEV